MVIPTRAENGRGSIPKSADLKVLGSLIFVSTTFNKHLVALSASLSGLHGHLLDLDDNEFGGIERRKTHYDIHDPVVARWSGLAFFRRPAHNSPIFW